MNSTDYVKAILKRPTDRDKQRKVGGSNIVNACTRCLADDLLGIPREQGLYDMGAILGTAIHAYLEERNMDPAAFLEYKLGIGYIPGYGKVSSRLDLYRSDVRQVVDYKGLALDTLLPTPTGWTTMGDVQVGDFLIDQDGKPTQVIGKSDVKNIGCYRVNFKDGRSVVCDEEHLWNVVSGWITEYQDETLNIVDIYRTMKPNRKYRVKRCKPLDLPEQDLPIDPYVLGVWLGDGNSSAPRLSLGSKKLGIIEEFRSRGVTLYPQSMDGVVQNYAFTYQGYHETLRSMGLLHNKHIPMQYLRASYQQRLDLLRGLMDTDGSYNIARDTMNINTTSKAMALGISELINSLGWKTRAREYTAKWVYGGVQKSKPAWILDYIPDQNVFLAREMDRPLCPRKKGIGQTWRVISSVEPVDTVPTQCVMVDSPTNTYLCTDGFIPTHNTTTRDKMRLYQRIIENGSEDGFDTDQMETARYTLESYVRQVNVYAWALAQDGYPVETVSIVFVCRDGSVVDQDVWGFEMPYDPALAVKVWERTTYLWEWLQNPENQAEDLESHNLCYYCNNVRPLHSKPKVTL